MQPACEVSPQIARDLPGGLYIARKGGGGGGANVDVRAGVH